MERNAITRPFDRAVESQQRNEGFASLVSINEKAAAKIAEVLGAMQMAKACPRDMLTVQRDIESEFSRPSLASKALYTYPKGGTTVSGLSIRAAESLARAMTNVKAGYEEQECNMEKHYSTIRAYAVDMERNYPVERVFRVEHVIDTKNGKKVLTSARDIYEIVANQSMRRVRACILELVPADLVDFALETIEATMQSSVNLGDPHVIEKLLDAFKEFSVNKAMLEAFIGRNISAMLPEQYTRLRGIWSSLRDGVARVDQFFDVSLSDAAQAAKKAVEDKPKEVEAKPSEEAVGGTPFTAEEQREIDAIWS